MRERQRTITWLAAATVALVANASSRGDEADPWPAPLIDIHGVEQRPFENPNTKALALIFILPDCPIANSYAPQWNRLHEAFASRGVRILLVHVDPALTAKEAQEHARQYQLKPPVLLDTRHELVKKAGVTKTPEAAVFSRAGKLLYRGRIDDRYVGLGKRRPEATSHDLRNALEAILAGKPVAPGREAVGCFIPELPDTTTRTE
jgi:hypothetical protein